MRLCLPAVYTPLLRRKRRALMPVSSSPSAISPHCPSVGTGVTAAASNLTDTVQTAVSDAVV